MVVVTCVVKSDMFVDRLRIIFVFLLSFRMPYRKRDQISRSYSLSWMWIQNHVQEKNKKKYPFLNKHQTCQYIYDLPVQSRIEAAIKDTQLRSHCSWYLLFTLPKLFCNVFFLWNCPIRGQLWKGEGKDVKHNTHVNIIPSTDPSSKLMILITCNKSCKTCLHQWILTNWLEPKALFALSEKIEFGLCKKFYIYQFFVKSYLGLCPATVNSCLADTPLKRTLRSNRQQLNLWQKQSTNVWLK